MRSNRVVDISKSQLQNACLKYQDYGCVKLIKQELNVSSRVLARLCKLHSVEIVRRIPTTATEKRRKYTRKIVAETGHTPQVLYYRRDPRIRLIAGAKLRARQNGLEFDLHPSDIVIPQACPVLGIPLIINEGGGTHSNNSPSLDRVDNNRGYVWDNVIIVSWRANRIKVDANIEELEKVVDFYRSRKVPLSRCPIVPSKKRTDRRLTAQQELEIAERYVPRSKGTRSNLELLAKEYGITAGYCSNIARRIRSSRA